jgi:hypothetical protein
MEIYKPSMQLKNFVVSDKLHADQLETNYKPDQHFLKLFIFILNIASP